MAGSSCLLFDYKFWHAITQIRPQVPPISAEPQRPCLDQRHNKSHRHHRYTPIPAEWSRQFARLGLAPSSANNTTRAAASQLGGEAVRVRLLPSERVLSNSDSHGHSNRRLNGLSCRQRASRTAIRMSTNFARRRKMPPTLTLSTIATSRRPSSISRATQSCCLGT